MPSSSRSSAILNFARVEIDAVKNDQPGLVLFRCVLMFKLSTRSMADAPCGGMLWQPHYLARVFSTLPCFTYYGFDVVESVIARNIQTFTMEKDHRE